MERAVWMYIYIIHVMQMHPCSVNHISKLMLTCYGSNNVWVGDPVNFNIVCNPLKRNIICGWGVIGGKRLLFLVLRGSSKQGQRQSWLPPNSPDFQPSLSPWSEPLRVKIGIGVDHHHDKYYSTHMAKDKVDQVPMSRHIPRGLNTSLSLTSWPHVTSAGFVPFKHVSVRIEGLRPLSVRPTFFESL